MLTAFATHIDFILVDSSPLLMLVACHSLPRDVLSPASFSILASSLRDKESPALSRISLITESMSALRCLAFLIFAALALVVSVFLNSSSLGLPSLTPLALAVFRYACFTALSHNA